MNKSVAFISFLIISISLDAQELSSLELKKQGIDFYRERDFQKADSAFRKCISQAFKESEWKSAGQCLNNLASVQFQIGQYAQGILNYEKAVKVYLDQKLDTLLGESYLNLGLAYKNRGIYDSATVNFYRGIEILETLNAKRSLMRGYNMLANTLRETGSSIGAKESYKKALSIGNVLEDERVIASILNNLGTVYRKENKLDTAIFYYEESRRLKLKANQFKSLANTHFNLGEVYLNLQSLDSAGFHISESIKYRKVANDKVGLAHSKVSEIRLFLFTGEIRKIPNRIVELKGLISQMSSKDLTLKTLEVEKDYLIAIGDYGKVNILDQEILELRDQILNEEKQRVVSSYEVMYGVKGLKQTINSQSQIMFWAFLLLAVLIIIGLFLLRERQRKEQAAEIVETLFKDMHHRVKNNLSLLNGVITFRRRELGDGVSKMMLKNIGGQVDTINLIHQRLYLFDGKTVGEIDLGEYLEELVENVFIGAGVSEEEFLLVVKNQVVNVSADKANYVGLIINEVVTNSIKYGRSNDGKWSIELSTELSGDDVLVFVKDRGNGNEEEKVKDEGVGMGLIRLLSKQLEASYEFDFSDGTSFSLEFKK